MRIISETQFEKMCRALKTAERERDLARDTLDANDKEIDELTNENDRLWEENKRLRGLLKEALESPRYSSVWERIQKEVGDENNCKDCVVADCCIDCCWLASASPERR
ncbi:hypothetical protein N9B88_01750 [Rubripirellula sp.]|nr:hypothetical protein [Rubripirellula sp.]